MKKINLVFIIPALLILVSCATQEKKVTTKKNEFNTIVKTKEGKNPFLYTIQVAGSPPPVRCDGNIKLSSWREGVRVCGQCAHERKWSDLEKLALEMSKSEIDSPWGAYYLSIAADARGEWERAIWMLDLAEKKIDIKFGLFTYQRGRILWRMDKKTEAVKLIEQSLKEDARILEAHLFLARAYRFEMDLKKSEEHYRAAQALDPLNNTAKNGLIELQLPAGADRTNRMPTSEPDVAIPAEVKPVEKIIHEKKTKISKKKESVKKSMKESKKKTRDVASKKKLGGKKK